jgi:hypothetical protein
MCAFVISVSKSSNRFAEKTSFYLVSLIDISMFWITVVCIFHMLNFANLVIVLGFFFPLTPLRLVQSELLFSGKTIILEVVCPSITRHTITSGVFLIPATFSDHRLGSLFH